MSLKLCDYCSHLVAQLWTIVCVTKVDSCETVEAQNLSANLERVFA